LGIDDEPEGAELTSPDRSEPIIERIELSEKLGQVCQVFGGRGNEAHWPVCLYTGVRRGSKACAGTYYLVY
jgi:hypothetical protein